MKSKIMKALGMLGCLGCLWTMTACENDDIEYPDFEYQTVYFARQTPIRTITLGDDVYSTDLDNQHRCQIYATMGGVNKNKKDRQIQIEVDESLCDGLEFSDGTPVKAMPREYYQLSGNSITIPSGQIMGAVDVQLTDAFFEDPASLSTTYVIPVKMVSATDSILEGKDYTLYAIKYKNKTHGCWLSRGTDEINVTDSATVTKTRMPEYWEDADLVYLTSDGLQQSRYQVSTNVYAYDAEGKVSVSTQICDLLLTFDDNDRVTISTDTPGCTASGSGQWTRLGEKKAWGDKDRDQLKLDYEVTYTYESAGKAMTKQVKTSETLVMRDRQSKLEDFTVKK